MYRPSVLFIALRYIHGRSIDQFNHCIYWISNISITLSISMIIMISSVMNGFERELKQNLLFFIPHATITVTKGYAYIQDIPCCLSRMLLKNIALYIKPFIISNVVLQSSKRILVATMLGVNPNDFEPLSNYLVHGSMNQLIPGEYRIIIGSRLAEQLSVNVNDQIRLTIPSVRQITPIGYIPSQRVFTVSGIYYANDIVDSYQVLVHQIDASKLMRYPSPQCITGWRIWLHEPYKIIKFIQEISIPKDWVWKDWREYNRSLFQAIKIEKIAMFLLFFLVIMISGFNIINFLVLSITEKQKEVAILKTYGFNRIQVMMLFIIQGISNGVIGMFFGTGLGIFLSKKLNQILYFIKIFPKTLQLPIDIRYFQIFNINLMVCIFIILIVVYPAWRAADIHPAQVLSYD